MAESNPGMGRRACNKLHCNNNHVKLKGSVVDYFVTFSLSSVDSSFIVPLKCLEFADIATALPFRLMPLICSVKIWLFVVKVLKQYLSF